MKKIIKIAAVALLFFGLGQDIFGYFQFQPSQVLPEKDQTAIKINQLFAYASTDFEGNFLLCNGSPELTYSGIQSIDTDTLKSEKYKVVYPKDRMKVGETVQSNFVVSCRAGLIFLNPKHSFYLFKFEYFKHAYIVDNVLSSQNDIVTQLNKLDPKLLEH